MMKKTIGLFGAALIASAGIGFASANETEYKKVTNPWKQCGIGAMLFSHEDQGMLALISNITWDLGSTAFSSKMSSPESCERRQFAAAQFVNTNYAALEVETARGDGEKLASVTELMGCSASAHSAIAQDVRAATAEDMAKPGFSKLDHSQKAEKYFNNVNGLVYGKYSSECKA